MIADIKRRMLKWVGRAIRMFETKLECSVNVRRPARDKEVKVKRRGPVSDNRDYLAPG